MVRKYKLEYYSYVKAQQGPSVRPKGKALLPPFTEEFVRTLGINSRYVSEEMPPGEWRPAL